VVPMKNPEALADALAKVLSATGTEKTGRFSEILGRSGARECAKFLARDT